jgi:hypothetical protein
MPKINFVIDTILIHVPEQTVMRGDKEVNILEHKGIKNSQLLSYQGRKFGHDSVLNLIDGYEDSSDEAVDFDTLEIDFPVEFQSSPSAKFVKVKLVDVIQYDLDDTGKPVALLNNGVIVCSDIIQTNPYGDYLLTVANHKYATWNEVQIFDTLLTFHLWVKDAFGKIIDLHPKKTRLIIQMELIF